MGYFISNMSKKGRGYRWASFTFSMMMIYSLIKFLFAFAHKDVGGYIAKALVALLGGIFFIVLPVYIIGKLVDKFKKENTEGISDVQPYSLKVVKSDDIDFTKRNSLSADENKFDNDHTMSELKQQDEEFIALLKSAVKENGLNTIPGDDLTEIYNRAKSTEASNNIPDIELSKAIDTVLEEIKKRGLSQESKLQANKQQEIHHYKDYSFEQDKAGGSSRWLYVIAISIIIIAIALVINKSFYSEAPKEPTFRLQDYYNKYKDFYGDIPLEDVAKDAYTRLEFNKDYATYDHFKKETGIEPLIQEDNDRRARSFLDKLKEVKIPFPFRFSEESIYGKLFRYDRFTSTVEIRYGYNKDTFKWMPRPQFKDLQHVRDALTQQEKNNHIRAIEEQTEALKNAQSHQQLSGSNMEQGGIMRKYEADKLKRDVEDIKNILEDEKRERDFQNYAAKIKVILTAAS